MAEIDPSDIPNWELLAQRFDELGAAFQAMAHAQVFNEVWGIPAPVLDRQDLAAIAFRISTKLKAVDWSEIDPQNNARFGSLAAKAGTVAGLVQQIPSHGGPLLMSIIAFLTSAESLIGGSVSPGQMRGVLALPLDLQKKAKLAALRLSEAEGGVTSVASKLAEINAAHAAAENLPVTEKELQDALVDVAEAKKAALQHELEAKQSSEQASKTIGAINDIALDAQSVQKKLHAAYSAATSQGLAQAFADKSRSLGTSMWWWTAILALALAGGGLIGWLRFPEILRNLAGKPDWGVVWAHMGLSFMSLAPVIWLAWVATKQIGQRFRLAEDYGYKAALAKAYEGYKAEAASIDPLMQAQLFGTALGRLDEIPLRLIEAGVPGSPLHELLQSKEFGQAIKNDPSLKEKVTAILRRTPEAQTDAVPTKGQVEAS